MGFSNSQKALLYTLLYSDIFNFPLTEEELWRGMISDKKIEINTFKKVLKNLCAKGITKYSNGLYCLAGREEIIKMRLRRSKITGKKFKIAVAVAKLLSLIPTIYFIGITGRLCHLDADKDDDIDMILITKKNTIWSTRLMLLSVLEFLDVRRTSSDTKPRNKICPNLIFDETALAWPRSKQDIYTAHEITHIYPLFDRNNLYSKFLNKNKWINRFYPNYSGAADNAFYIENPKKYYVLRTISFFLTLPPVEFIFDKFQRFYMSGKITNETIKHNLLAFHPHDYRPEILQAFNKKIRQFK